MGQLTRRQVTKAAAWSVPVIATAAAAPAYAASDAADFDAQVDGGCMSTGTSGYWLYFRIIATGATPVPAGQQITIEMHDPDWGGQLTPTAVYTATSGGTEGVTGITVSADQTTWSATTTRSIGADLADHMHLYVSGVGFNTNGETGRCTITTNDTDPTNNTALVTKVSLWDGLCVQSE